ncbi:MAG: TIM barrel protein [Phascolarctobacterium sp.]|nr:TIM barrel protein [Phascolarctobacterium sp.]
MTKHLFNYCTIDWYENDMIAKGTTLREFSKEFALDGMEQFIYTMERPAKSYKDLTTGVHLNYWPYWMDFWLKKAKRLKQQFRNVIERNQYFRDALSREEWLSVIRKNIGAALTEAPEYMVWHVAEANNEEIFTWEFNYSDREVLTASADVFNSIADEIPENVTVLFENLWWPGLRLTDPRNVKYFFERIERKNVGIMLDTGHLMNTNNRLKNEAEAADYVCRVYEKLGSCAELVKGVHLSCSLSGQYQRSFDRRVPANLDNAMIWQHVASIDTHQPFTTEAARQILQCINPEYVVHEFTYDNMDELRNKLAVQLEHCR